MGPVLGPVPNCGTSPILGTGDRSRTGPTAISAVTTYQLIEVTKAIIVTDPITQFSRKLWHAYLEAELEDDFEVGELELPLGPEVNLPRQTHVRGLDGRGVLL